jgi:hypothetical protein
VRSSLEVSDTRGGGQMLEGQSCRWRIPRTLVSLIILSICMMTSRVSVCQQNDVSEGGSLLLCVFDYGFEVSIWQE